MKETTYLLKINGKPICTGTLATLQSLAVQIPADNSWSIGAIIRKIGVLNFIKKEGSVKDV